MKRILGFILGFVLLSASTGLTQEPADATNNPDPATREQVLKIFQLMDVPKQMSTVAAGMKQQLLPSMMQDLKKRVPDAPPEMLQEISGVFTDNMTDMFNTVGGETATQAMIPIYEKHLSKKEADALIAFYSSPEGQSFMKKSPVMGLEAMQSMFSSLKAKIESMSQQSEGRIEEICKKYGVEIKPAVRGN